MFSFISCTVAAREPFPGVLSEEIRFPLCLGSKTIVQIDEPTVCKAGSVEVYFVITR